MHRLPEEFHGGVAVATVDVDEASDLADARDVTAIPYFILLKDGAQVRGDEYSAERHCTVFYQEDKNDENSFIFLKHAERR